MTRNEAIKIVKDIYENNYSKYSVEELKTAIGVWIRTIELQDNLGEEWISIKDNMPIIGEDVLLRDYDGDTYIGYLHLDGSWGFDNDGNKIKNIVAWKPTGLGYIYENDEEKDADN